MKTAMPAESHSSATRGKPSASFDIDSYLNHLIPRNHLDLLPSAISHSFGYRPPRPPATPSKLSQLASHRLPTPLLYLSCFTGAFVGVSIIEAVYAALPHLSGHSVPLVIASFGAAAILEYNTIESPLAQPRNLVFGHFLSALIGVSITKLFHLLPESQFEALRWLAGALAVASASVAMSFTKTVHPPAGATALLAATSAEITLLGWWLIPLVLLGSMLMLSSALLINNVGRRFPMYWWTPVDLKALRNEQKSQEKQRTTEDMDVEHQAAVLPGDNNTSSADSDTSTEVAEETDIADAKIRNEWAELRLSMSENINEIVITPGRISLPTWLEASDWEINVLRIIQERLASGRNEE